MITFCDILKYLIHSYVNKIYFFKVNFKLLFYYFIKLNRTVIKYYNKSQLDMIYFKP
jgi:hypothetical protein